LGEREREAATYSGAIKIKVWIGLHSFIFLLIYYQELELLPHWTGKIYNTRKKKKKKNPSINRVWENFILFLIENMRENSTCLATHKHYKTINGPEITKKLFLLSRLTAFWYAFKDCRSLLWSQAPVTKKLVRHAFPRLSVNKMKSY